MTPERSTHYGVVMQMVRNLSSKLHDHEQELIRFAADEMLLSASMADPQRQAFEQVRDLMRSLVESRRWQFETANNLQRRLWACGPTVNVSIPVFNAVRVEEPASA